MASCFVTSTGCFLPGSPVGNNSIQDYLGELDGESDVKARVLKMNGIVSRHYAQDTNQNATETVYSMAAGAVADCLGDGKLPITFLSAGSTYAPLAAPGIGSIIHSRLSQRTELATVFSHPTEISSHAGVCTSSAAALVSSIRAIESESHGNAIAIGTEHSSEVLKSSRIAPIDDRESEQDLRKTRWFMSVFLRFMLSDGAGAMLLASEPAVDRFSLKVNWTYSRSFAGQAPLCMKLDNSNALLSQDVDVLSKHLFPCARQFAEMAFDRHQDSLSNYEWVLPHLSSFFFRKRMERMLNEFAGSDSNDGKYWTNLATAGNTGAASIFVMLDQFLKQEKLVGGERILLFIPESGQFNFVMVSLTVVAP